MPEPIDRAHEDPQLLAQIGQAAAEANLGQHRSAHPAMHAWQHRNRWSHRISAVVMSVATIVGIVVDGNWWFLTGIIALGLIVALVANLFTARRYYGKSRGVRLDLYANGLIYSRIDGLNVARYDHTTVEESITHYKDRYGRDRRGGIIYQYHLTDVVGERFLLRGNLDQPKVWGPAIQQGVVDAQLSPAWAALEAGQRIEFGVVWMTRTELGKGGKSVAWNQIERVGVDNGAVAVSLAGKILPGFTVAVRDMANFQLFQALSAHILRLHTQSGAGRAG